MSEANNNFDELERELREDLAARPAPFGFAARVMARIDTREKSATRMPLWRWVAAAAALAAVLLAVVAGGRWQRQREERIAGEQARAQVILALRITGSTLDVIQQKVQQSGKEIQP